MRPRNKISTLWTPQLAYAIGLITTDGSLSKDGRHIVFVSKDIQLIHCFQKCLGIENKVSIKKSGYSSNSFAYFVQFGDIGFYQFLLSIGLMPNKSKTMSAVQVPTRYFFDFLRGHFDGDGSFYSYWDKRWASSFLFYLIFMSASKKHLFWLRDAISSLIGVKGHMNLAGTNRAYQLKYAKNEAKLIIKKMYKDPNCPRLERKFEKVYNVLAVDEQSS